MKRLFLVFLLVPFVFKMNGSHLVGGDMSFECLGGNKYKIFLDLYRDADLRNVPPGQTQPTPFDDFAYFVIFDAGTNTIFDRREIALKSEQKVIENDLGVCLTSPPVINFFRGRYEFEIDLPQNGNGYNIVHIRCCRSPGISNLVGSGNQGSTYMLHVSNESLSSCNNGPKFQFAPPILLCTKVELDFDHSAIDIEGDVIRYRMCAPLSGGSPECPFYGPLTLNPGLFCAYDPSAPPYQQITYSGAYSALEPLGKDNMGNNVVKLNENTGRLQLTPQAEGKFVVGVCMEEFRGGKLMSRSFRDFQFNMNNCGVAAASLANLNEFQCDGFTVNFDPEGSVGATTYFWEFGDGTTSTESNPTHTYAVANSYPVKLTINKGLPCESEASKVINVFPEFNVDFEYDIDCTSGKIMFDNKTFSSFNDVNSSKWYFNNSTSPIEETNPIFNLTNESNLLVKLVSTTLNGCQDSFEINISIEKKPKAEFSISNVCARQQIEINNLSTSESGNIDRYKWIIDGITYDDFEPSIQFEQAGIKEFLLVTYSSSGCKDSILKEITILDSISLKIIAPNEICSNQSVKFSAVSDGSIKSYNWDFGNGVSGSQAIGEVIYETSGNFNIVLDIETEFCGGKTRNTNVSVSATPDYNLLGSLDICEGSTQELIIDVLNVEEPEILWSNGDGGASTTVLSSDEELSVVVTNGACSKRRDITVVNECDIYVPNAFAPNGLNRGFMIVDKNVSSFELFIYNRWGEMLFYSSDFNFPWDGNYKGSPAPLDTYAYFVKGTKSDGQYFEQRGAFTLIR